ncbi:hypothetical protein P3342_007293 [Pyrenophora teres f. teres]|nr:hypothetical protein P3342_007293 [Pyrenophora teres f. teres]
MTFDHRSKAYQRQNNARRITPMTEQPHQPGPTAAARQPQQDSLPVATRQPLAHTLPPPPVWQVPQDLQQAEQYEARQSARSQEPPPVHQNTVAPESQYMSGALGGRQPRQQWAQGDRSQSWRPQTQRPPTTAYREITPFPQQPIMGVPDRPPELPYDPYKTLPPRWSRNDRLNANTITQLSKNKDKSEVYITKKEEADHELAIKLRNDGVITTPGTPFEASDDQEISDLVGRGVFEFEQYDKERHGGIRIFKSRLVREVKGKTTKPYEKSRLVIQGYQDHGKEAILTQSPTIQRCSQRVILAPVLVQRGMSIELRDITQAYPQAQTNLQRTILTHLPSELVSKYPEGTLLHVIKPLYGIAEAGVHWWTTYHSHHREELDMSTSTYDPCLLITNGDADAFGLVGMQTDDTLMLGTAVFSSLEEKKLEEAQFRSKPKTGEAILNLKQKGQGGKIKLVDIKAYDRAQQYTEQRPRAYIASTCQPEASFDLSVAAQAQQPSDEDIKALNKRLKWQIENLDRGIRYVPVNLINAKLMVFVDGSFANNKDLSSQLGFVLMLVNECADVDNTFSIHGNMIHYSSTKCKRVTRSVLASKIYSIVNSFDIGIAIATTLRMITERLGISAIPLIVCTDSYSLYECLVKLGTTKEKRLMIDIMALRQSYERREITEIRWINGEDNPADAFTKASPNRALERFIDGNKLTVRVDGWVQRPTSFDV